MAEVMRRKDRQLSQETAYALLEKGKVCHLALAAQGEPYIVTLNYGYRDSTLYFHCARAGKKLDLLAQNNRVCFTVAPSQELVLAESACDYSMKYESVVGYGSARMIEDREEKRRALGIIMAQYAEGSFDFPEKALAATAVFVVDIESLTAKSNF